MEDLEERAILQSSYKPEFWVRFKDDIFYLWEHGDESLGSFLHLLNSLDPKLKFTQESEVERRLPFLDVLVHRNDSCFEFSVYRKPTHNDRYLSYSSNHSPAVKRGVVTSLVDRALKFDNRIKRLSGVSTLTIDPEKLSGPKFIKVKTLSR